MVRVNRGGKEGVVEGWAEGKVRSEQDASLGAIAVEEDSVEKGSITQVALGSLVP